MQRLLLAAALLMASPAAASYIECEAARKTRNRLLWEAEQSQEAAWLKAGQEACPPRTKAQLQAELDEAKAKQEQMTHKERALDTSVLMASGRLAMGDGAWNSDCLLRWKLANHFKTWQRTAPSSVFDLDAADVEADMSRMGCR